MDERSAIAGELHDSLAQALSYMKLQIARLQLEIGRSCTACTPGSAMLDISGEIKTGLDSAYRHLRELLSAFRTSMPPGGLHQALREVVDELEARAGTGVSLDFRLGSQPLTANEEFHLLQIVREALTNVIRHARAAHAVVHLAPLPGGEVAVRIEDDGRGIAPDAGGEGHHGLSIMRERARQLDGTLAIQPGNGGGTCVEIRFRPRTAPTESNLRESTP
jgi:two-component system nitrate/nitrite sensor histidine kinase NarX